MSFGEAYIEQYENPELADHAYTLDELKDMFLNEEITAIEYEQMKEDSQDLLDDTWKWFEPMLPNPTS